ncbi:hypothetical protein K2P96_00640 [Patescibacteria group bacterium]|nr:hypothetical protein [Patescibacteria group bacterium]
MQNSPRSFQKFKKIPLFFSVLFFGATIFGFIFLYKQIEENKIISAEMQQKWQTEANRRSQIQSLDRLIKSTETERSKLQTHFAQTSDVVPFLDTVQKLATKVGAESEVVSVDILKDKSSVLAIQVRATGSFQSVYKFLTLLENSPYELDFSSVDLQNTTPQATDGAKVTGTEWSADFRIKLLSFIP